MKRAPNGDRLQYSSNANPDNGVKGPNIYIVGTNVHIQSGSGNTQPADQSGLGNLIVGYDEIPADGSTFAPSDRQGSHNLVIGRYNRFPEDGAGNFVGGMYNTAFGDSCFVVGQANTATGEQTDVLGGMHNTTNSFYTVVVGGQFNTAASNNSVIVGGSGNTEPYSDTSGGSVILGGQVNSDNSAYSVIFWPGSV